MTYNRTINVMNVIIFSVFLDLQLWQPAIIYIYMCVTSVSRDKGELYRCIFSVLLMICWKVVQSSSQMEKPLKWLQVSLQELMQCNYITIERVIQEFSASSSLIYFKLIEVTISSFNFRPLLLKVFFTEFYEYNVQNSTH